jgi:predicted dienelactone hydrolase
MRCLTGLLLGFVLTTAAPAQDAPSRPAVDAPELAKLGDHGVGHRTVTVVDDQRRLVVEVWYPATVAGNAEPVTYSGSFTAEPPAAPTKFTRPGIAIRDATPASGRFPLVIASHGYDNDAIALSWLTENLASKGYVVAAIRHSDPPITDRSGFPQVLLRRPLDIAFVAGALPAALGDSPAVDASRVAMVGYSMGGYGVLTAAGAELDPAGPVVTMVPDGRLKAYARGGESLSALRIAGLKAVVALAPAGGSLNAWGADGIASITAPLLLIAGDRDGTVDYASGARTFFHQATRSDRYLLTYLGGGHRIGLGPAPAEMRHRLWDQDWFDDAVWSPTRVVGINLHFITAFLDRYVKDDASRASYLDGLTPRSNDGSWPPSADEAYGAYSPGTDGITLWKGFQRGHAEGLELLHAKPR